MIRTHAYMSAARASAQIRTTPHALRLTWSDIRLDQDLSQALPESAISLCPEIPKAFYVETHSALARITHSKILTYLKDKGYVCVDQIAEGLGIPDSTLSDHLTVTKPQDCSPRANPSIVKDLIVSL